VSASRGATRLSVGEDDLVEGEGAPAAVHACQEISLICGIAHQFVGFCECFEVPGEGWVGFGMFRFFVAVWLRKTKVGWLLFYKVQI